MTGNGAAALDVGRLRGAAAGVGVDLADDHIAALARHAQLLDAANARGNLTRITAPAEVAVRHMADSLACLPALDARLGGPGGRGAPPRAPALVDVGSGAGFPGLPLAVVRRTWSFTLVEATGRKAGFLEEVIRVLDLGNAAAIAARAEDAGRGARHRESYAVAVARAVAPLAVLAEYMLPLVRVGGWAVAMKGRDPRAEIAAARQALDALGGSLEEVVPYRLPDLGTRHLVVVAKVAPTPPEFPRRAGRPGKRPIGG